MPEAFEAAARELLGMTKTPLDKVAFLGKPEIRLELKLEHRSISQIRLELDYRHFALI